MGCGDCKISRIDWIAVVARYTAGGGSRRVVPGGATSEIPPDSKAKIVVPVNSGAIHDLVVDIDAHRAVIFGKAKITFKLKTNRKGSGKLVTQINTCCGKKGQLVDQACFKVPVAKRYQVLVNQFAIPVWIDSTVIVAIVAGIVEIGKRAPVGEAGTTNPVRMIPLRSLSRFRVSPSSRS